MPATNKVKKQAILNAALELFAEQGFHDAPMAGVAAKAGVGVGSIYRYFVDKPGLIEELHKQVDAALQTAIVRGVDSGLSSRQQFLQLITNLIHFLHDHPRTFLFLEQYYHSPFGIAQKRENRLIQSSSMRKNHFMDLLFAPNNLALKSIPLQGLLALAFGPVLFVMRDAIAGLVNLDDALILQVAEGCRDAVSSKIS